MKVSVLSEMRQKAEKMNWYLAGEDISYFKNGINKTNIPWGEQYYTLSFTFTFPHDKDTVFFAYSVPYSFSDLRNDL